MAPLSNGDETDEINWELAMKNYLYVMNFFVIKFSKLDPYAPAYSPKDKLKIVVIDVISKLNKKHNVSVFVYMRKDIGDRNVKTSNKIINAENIDFLEMTNESFNGKRKQDEQNRDIVCIQKQKLDEMQVVIKPDHVKISDGDDNITTNEILSMETSYGGDLHDIDCEISGTDSSTGSNDEAGTNEYNQLNTTLQGNHFVILSEGNGVTNVVDDDNIIIQLTEKG